MTSWIVAIDKTYPQHWDIAAKHGFWDMTKNMRIERADHVYFWLSGKSLVSQTVATLDARPLTRGDVPPWEDSGARVYRYRFPFRTVSEKPLDQPSWGTLQAATGVTASPHFGPNKVTSAEGEAWLAASFKSEQRPEDVLPEPIRVTLNELLGSDLRERVLREIAIRQGQPAFRSSLRQAYRNTCAITGYDVESVLEAAHISPYLGDDTNVVTNGLLLRADIHTLFDKHLVTVTADFTVHVSPQLDGTPYADLNGRPLKTIPAQSQRPSPDVLAAHNGDCAWLTA